MRKLLLLLPIFGLSSCSLDTQERIPIEKAISGHTYIIEHNYGMGVGHMGRYQIMAVREHHIELGNWQIERRKDFEPFLRIFAPEYVILQDVTPKKASSSDTVKACTGSYSTRRRSAITHRPRVIVPMKIGKTIIPMHF